MLVLKLLIKCNVGSQYAVFLYMRKSSFSLSDSKWLTLVYFDSRVVRCPPVDTNRYADTYVDFMLRSSSDCTQF